LIGIGPATKQKQYGDCAVKESEYIVILTTIQLVILPRTH